MLAEPHELTDARRAYLKASAAYARWSQHVRDTGGTGRTRATCEKSRLRLRAAYLDYQDALATVGAPA